MAICDTCGNEYDKSFMVTCADGHTATFDCIECAAVGLAPACVRTLRLSHPGPRRRDRRQDLLLRKLRPQSRQHRRE